ncbi:MAG: nuclear transport factor 2 family protein [Actinomycetota bacterium]
MTDPASPDPRAVADRAEIIDVACRYTWALDTQAFDDLDDVFLPDATGQLGSPTVLDGRPAIKERIRTALSPLDVSQHLVGSHVVELDADDPDRATHRCQLHAQHVRAAAADELSAALESGADMSVEAQAAPAQFIVAGIYDDRFVRTPDGWRIEHRTLTVTWTSGNPGVNRPRR